MREQTSNATGFGLIGVLLIIIVLAVIGGAGVYVYHRDHKITPATSSGSNRSSTPPKGSTNTDPYAGWATASLKYEKATFKYPSSWQLNNSSTPGSVTQTVAPGSDQAVLTSPTGLTVRIDTGVAGFPNATSTVLLSQPISTLGGRYYLDFYTNDSSNPTDAEGACITANNNPGAEFGFVPSKNIQITGTPSSTANDVACIEYSDAQGKTPEKPVSAFQQDASFNDAKLVIQSLAY